MSSLPPSLLKWFAVVVLLGLWWIFLAPTQLGGQTGYTYVSGESMLPTLHSGDLVVTRQQHSYGLGDRIVFRTADLDLAGVQTAPARVIHRIVGGSPAGGWITKGDNNPRPDPWRVGESSIVGRYEVMLPGLGGGLETLRSNPLLAALAAAGLVMVPWSRLFSRRARRHPALDQALAAAFREDTSEGRPSRLLAAVAPAAATLGACLLIARAMTLNEWTRRTWVELAALLLLGATVHVLATRAARGRTDLSRALHVFAGRLHLVRELPSAPASEVRAAGEFEALARRHRLPVLHSVERHSGEHHFLLITEAEGAFRWSAVQAF